MGVEVGQGAVGVGATRPPSGALPATLQGTLHVYLQASIIFCRAIEAKYVVAE